ncbi:aldose epimerase family protein [Taklimakanibacter deserti]|uniref:aldose epimerase family protein n=1 Tax=Taklimakanibacter deserti TaxID=2267839 RepID=UPI0034D70543
MTTERQDWGALDGQEFSTFTIRNAHGASLVLSDYGATALQMNIPSPTGEIADVILGFDSLKAYRDAPTYFGATVGRFGNRIRRGKFTLDGKAYQASCNEGENSLHGGVNGFDKRKWAAAFDPKGNSVKFALTSPDGDEGFPGKLTATSQYTLTDDGTLRIDLSASTDRPTLCNMVHHSYFNLAGHASGTVLDQELEIHADFYTPVDDELIITGEVMKVAETPFDFRKARRIGQAIDQVANAGAGRVTGSGGYDHNWCLKGEAGRLRPVLWARDPASGRGFELWTTEPGVHFYTGGYLDSSVIGKGGHPYRKFSGFTLETQKFPDGPNLSHVPQSRLDPGEDYHHVMEFRFFTPGRNGHGG